MIMLNMKIPSSLDSKSKHFISLFIFNSVRPDLSEVDIVLFRAAHQLAVVDLWVPPLLRRILDAVEQMLLPQLKEPVAGGRET